MSQQDAGPPAEAEASLKKQDSRRLARERTDSAASVQRAVAGGPIYLLATSQPAAPLHQTRPLRPNLRRQVLVASSEAAVCAPMELASAATRVARPGLPPKRPTALPARYAAAAKPSKPNRYSLAQMQHWQQEPAQQHHFSSPFSSAASRVLVVNPMQIVNLSEHTKSRLIKIIEALKRFSEQWFSHVLLLLFLAVYACFGAYIFISFEAPTEQWEKQLIIDTRLQLVNDTWAEATGGRRSQQDFSELFRARLEDYERLLNKACASGMTSSSLENQWTFWGALFYSMTVFTTIGYGHLTPITFAGRVATMVYAIFGIPILLMVLADLGKLLTRIIKYAFKKFRLLFNKLLRRKSSLRTRKLIRDNTSQCIGVARSAFERGYAHYIQPYNRFPAAFAAHRRKRPSSEAAAEGAPVSEVLVTPGGQTEPVSPSPGEPRPQHPLHSSRQGHAHANSQHHPHHAQRSHSPAGGQRARKTSSTGSHRAASPARRSAKAGSVPRSNSLSGGEKGAKQEGAAGAKADSLGEISPAQSNHETNEQELSRELPTGPMEEEEAEEGPLEEEIEDEFDIPVSFALFLLVTYMMFGAVVFSIWEGWNFFDSLYFVFISMSTIGFGDLVPQHPKRMIGTFIYLLFGLALTSMCINVVQEKIHATFLRAKMQIGEKMGLDLEQIMADDYYDGSSALDPDEASESASATNSWLTHAAAQDHHWPDEHAHEPGQLPEAGVKPSKSRDSMKPGAKKRSVAGLPGHSNASHGGSLRRKPSQKRISRQVTPSSFSQDPAPSQQHSPPPSAAPAPSPQPVKAELRRQVSEALADQPHLINQPVGVARAELCEPLSPRACLLLAGRAQPPAAVVKSLSSEIRPTNRAKTDRKSTRTQGRSADSSRRSSVSQELNQLDDLIKALSKSPASERFGPLLGIPSSAHSSRSTSPLGMNARRATSVISRPTTPTSARKKISLVAPVPPLSLRDSEKALDELEAIKFSAV